MNKFDVAVAGGGPAGAALARRLAQLGHRVALVERRPAPSRGFAESLPPGVAIHLQTLGVDLPPSWPVAKKLVRWNGETEIVDAPSQIVDRAVFDAHLLRAAADAGVLVLQPATFDSAGIEATIVADATGRAGLLRVPRRNLAPRAFALRARWSGVDAPPELRIERRANGWIWGAPRGARAYDVAIFAEHEPPRIDAVHFDFLDREPDAIQLCDATPYVVDEPIGPGFVIVGDAASTIDPLASAGVQKALGTAIAAAAAVHTILCAPERTQAAIDFYRAKIKAAAARHAAWAAELYEPGPERPIDMIGPECEIALDPRARLVDAPVLAGDLIELRRVVETPAGEQVAWLGTADLPALLAPLRAGMTAGELARSWRMPAAETVGAMRWLVRNEVLAVRG